MEEKLYWLGFSVFPGIGPVRFQRLLAYFGSARNAWEATVTDLRAAKLGEMLTAAFDNFRAAFSPAAYSEELHRRQIDYLALIDEQYPPLLAKSRQAPLVLYVKGKFDFTLPENQQTIAVVGSRKMTEYGRQVTELFTRELVSAGCVIVSGLALGVDACSHAMTVDQGGRTIAVLGCGVDCCYPIENAGLYKYIVESGGAVVSEFPLGSKPTKGSFPSRNRIIAGLSLGVIVTEGAEDSGALITAEDAFANNRPVFAVPGPITSTYSQRPNKLIGKSGRLVTKPEEVLEELGLKGTKAHRYKGLKEIRGDTAEEQVIIDLLQNQSLHIDDLVRKTRIEPAKVGGLLSLMEVKGMVKALDPGYFGLTS